MQTDVSALAIKTAQRYAPAILRRIVGVPWWPNSERHVVASILGADGMLPDFLPRLGVRRVEFFSINQAQFDGLVAALDHDLWRCSLTLPESAPTLAEKADRWLMEARFARAMALPLAAGAAALWPGWVGATAGIGVAMAGVYALSHVTAEFTAGAEILLLAAIDSGYAEAPTVTAYGIDQWGPNLKL